MSKHQQYCLLQLSTVHSKQVQHSNMAMQTLQRTTMATMQTRMVRSSNVMRPAALPAPLPMRLSTPGHRRSSTIVAAVDTEPPKTDNENKPELAKFADSVGGRRSASALHVCTLSNQQYCCLLVHCNKFGC